MGPQRTATRGTEPATAMVAPQLIPVPIVAATTTTRLAQPTAATDYLAALDSIPPRAGFLLCTVFKLNS